MLRGCEGKRRGLYRDNAGPAVLEAAQGVGQWEEELLGVVQGQVHSGRLWEAVLGAVRVAVRYWGEREVGDSKGRS